MTKIKPIRQIFNFKDKHQHRNVPIYRITRSVGDALDLVWNKRTYPNPKNKNEDLFFRSQQEFVDYCMRKIINCGETFWAIFTFTGEPKFSRV